jgi:parallel beta-helix repeat protein
MRRTLLVLTALLLAQAARGACGSVNVPMTIQEALPPSTTGVSRSPGTVSMGMPLADCPGITSTTGATPAVQFFGAYVTGARTGAPASDGVTVAPSDNLQNLVNANPAGTTFSLQAGVHHDSVTSLKNGDTFTGQPGAVENGAKVLTGWTQVKINSTQYWTTAGGTPLSSNGDSSFCEAAYPGCFYSQDLYFDNVTYTHVTSLANVAASKWYYDFAGGDGGVVNNVYLTDNPTGHVVELGANYYLFQSSTATNITIQGLTVEKYAPRLQHGAIQAGIENQPAANLHWTIQNCELRLNHGYGVHAQLNAGGIQGYNNVIHDNGQGSFAGSGAGAIWKYNTLYHNNVDYVRGGWEAGHKWSGNHSLVAYNVVHDNIVSPGLWTDSYTVDVTYDHNTVYNNGYAGIRYEISDQGTITNNTVYNNGLAQVSGQVWEIDYANSSHGTIQNNLITVSAVNPGIIIHYSNTLQCSRPPDNSCTVPVGMNISGNVIQGLVSGSKAARAVSNSGSTTAWQLPGMFDRNCYQVSNLPWTNVNWELGTETYTNINFTAWQAGGQDVNGLTASTCPNATSVGAGLSTTLRGGAKLSGNAVVH